MKKEKLSATNLTQISTGLVFPRDIVINLRKCTIDPLVGTIIFHTLTILQLFVFEHKINLTPKGS